MKSITGRIYLLLLTSSMAIALTPKPEFIWYLYPMTKVDNQLYGYKPKPNVSFFPEEIVGDVVVQEDAGVHGVFLKEAPDGANKIVLGNLSDTLGDMSAFPTFTISFLFKILPNITEFFKLKVFNAFPFKEQRANSNPIEIYLQRIDKNITLYSAVGQHDLVSDAPRTRIPDAVLSQWNHVTIVYHGSHENGTTEVYLNGTRAPSHLYEQHLAPEPANASPFVYSIGHDEGPSNLSLSWFQLFRETLSAEQVKEHADYVISKALEATQVEVKFNTTSITARRVDGEVESVNLLLLRTGNVELASIVRLAATMGAAKSGNDFSFPPNGIYVFRPGEVYRSINYQILNFPEDRTTFMISIQPADDGVTTVTQEGTVTITIVNNTGPEQTTTMISSSTTTTTTTTTEEQTTTTTTTTTTKPDSGGQKGTFVTWYLVLLIVLPLTLTANL